MDPQRAHLAAERPARRNQEIGVEAASFPMTVATAAWSGFTAGFASAG